MRLAVGAIGCDPFRVCAAGVASTGGISTMILETSQPKLAHGCKFGSDDVLLVPEGVLRLKGPAVEILRRCDGQKTFAEIVDEMRQHFSGVVESDVQEFLGKLQERGVVEL